MDTLANETLAAESATAPAPAPAPLVARLGWIDGLRALAALFVVVHHAHTSIPNRRDTSWTYWLHYGHFSVDLFIVLSGYCLMLPAVKNFGYLPGGILRFIKRRARRILPPYYFAVAISLALIYFFIGHKTGTHWDDALPVTGAQIVANLFLVHDVFGDSGRINYVFWSIAVEWQIYFVFPLMLVLWRRVWPVVATALITIGSCLLYQLIRGKALEGITVQYLALFAFGMLAAEVSLSSRETYAAIKKPEVLFGVFAVFTIVLVKLCDRWGTIGHWVVLDLIVGTLAFVILVAASLPGKNALRSALSWKPLVALGTFAYSIYLIHAPLLQIIWQYIIHPLHRGAQFEESALIFLGTPVIVCIAYLFFLCFEKPWLVRKNVNPAAAAAVNPAP